MNQPVCYSVAGLRRPVAVAGQRFPVAGQLRLSVCGEKPPARDVPAYKVIERLQGLENDLEKEMKRLRVDIAEVREYVRDGEERSKWGNIWPKVIEAGATVAATVLVTLLVRRWWSAERVGRSEKKAAEEALQGPAV